MDTRQVSAAAGFILLMGCIVGVVVVIYHGGSARSSYKTTVEESWKKRETRMKERNELGLSPSETSVQEAKLLTEELQKLFTKTPNTQGHSGSGSGASGYGGDGGKGEKNEKSKSNAKSLSGKKIPSVVMNLPTLPNHQSSPEVSNGSSYDSSMDDGTREGGVHKVLPKVLPHQEDEKRKESISIVVEEESTPTVREGMGKNEFHETPWTPSINPRLEQIAPHQITNANRDTKDSRLLLVVPPPPPPSSSSLPLSPERESHTRPSLLSMSTTIHSDSGTNLSDNTKRMRKDDDQSSFPSSVHHKFTEPEWQDDLGDDEDLLLDEYEQQYLLDDDDDRDIRYPRDPLKDMGKLFELATDLYKKGTNASNFDGFIKVINETVQRGNNSGLLTQLNELYSRPGIGSTLLTSPTSDTSFGRNAYENSLTAFVFMSFGIFLLNQIHNFVGEESFDGKTKVQGRSFESNSLIEESELNVLFQPPPLGGNNHGSESGDMSTKLGEQMLNFGNGQRALGEESKMNETLKNEEHFPGDNSSDVPDYVNNMFRAALNLVNAYTKDTKALECIWSLYCQDLDKTAAKQGSLYSLAARINSIGLRLIMGQIPTELTVDVMLRSLLGWDGLPCMKMFPKCRAEDGTVSLQMKGVVSGNLTSL